ncbi:hypothetical protein BGX28_005478 [Mortierella sp. GBA30]|nr:hypothetical protein BGX28_005478 [Mortierella sp. GBA30]
MISTQEQERELKNLLHQKGATGVTHARDRLREEYEGLILTDIIQAQAKEIESALWKNVFYIVIDGYRRKLASLDRHENADNQQQQDSRRRDGGRGGEREGGGRSRPHGTRGNKKPVPSVEFRKVSTKFRAFIQEATGFYHRLIQSLTAYYDLNESGESGASLQSFPIGDKRPMLEITEAARQCAINSCHKCYIFLGDLARYRQTYNDSPKKNWSAARDYYNEARNLLPSSGNPYNQLAVIATFAPNNFLALYFYYRSLAVRLPFMTARNNIKVLIQKMTADPEKNKKFVKDERYNDRQVANAKDSSQLNEFLSKFILLHGAIFMRSADDFDAALMGESMERLVLERQIDPDLLLKIQIINMSSLYTMCYIPIQDDGAAKSPQHQTESERQALQLIFDAFATILRYSTMDLEKHRNGEYKSNGRPADFLPSVVHRSMPTLRLSLKWMQVNLHHVKRLTDGISVQEKEERFKFGQILDDLATFLNLLGSFHWHMEDTIFCRDVLKEDAELQGFAALKRAIDERPLSIIPPSRISPKAEMQMRIADMFQDALNLSKSDWLEFYAVIAESDDGKQILRFSTVPQEDEDSTVNVMHPTDDVSAEGIADESEEEEEETDYERDAADEDMNPFHIGKLKRSPAPPVTSDHNRDEDDAPLDQEKHHREAVAALLSEEDNDLSLIVGNDDDENENDEEEEEVVLFTGRSNVVRGKPTPKPAHLKMSTGVIGGGRRASMSPTGSNHSSPGMDVNGPAQFGHHSSTVNSLFGGFQFGVTDDWRESISSLRSSRTSDGISGISGSNNTWGGGHLSNALGNGMISPTTTYSPRDANALGGFTSIPVRGPPGIPLPMTSPLSTADPSAFQDEEHSLYQQHSQRRHTPHARPKYQYQSHSVQQQSGYFQHGRNGVSGAEDGDWR